MNLHDFFENGRKIEDERIEQILLQYNALEQKEKCINALQNLLSLRRELNA